MKRKKGFDLRKLNNVLTAIAVGLAIYVIVLPFLPGVWWWADHLFNKPNLSVVQVSSKDTQFKQPIPAGYWLTIPRINLHQQIYTGQSMYEVNLGVWHIWGTSSPNKGSNTVVAAHRWTYFNPHGVFYYLDKVELNDRVTVDWNGTEYTYKVSNIKIVPPTDVAIYNSTKDSRLTMYTCTPLVTAANRLIVTAELVGKRTA